VFVEVGDMLLANGRYAFFSAVNVSQNINRYCTGSEREEAYRYFISSLKSNPSYAPSFTSFGIYYLEQASPPDPTRASKCFQKAFELDAREAEAARRLAEGFAEEGEWELVEVVARRVIDGEGGLDGGVGGGGGEGRDGDGVPSGRYLPTNAWAWKAVGVVELVGPSPITSHPD
jgi:superkiller protein 3